MIKAEIPGLASLAKRLSARADRLGEAAAENRARARRHDPGRWRKSELLWPLFGKGR